MEADPLAELLEIARDLRTQLAWQVQSGSLGLPRASAEDVAKWFPQIASAEAPSGPASVAVRNDDAARSAATIEAAPQVENIGPTPSITPSFERSPPPASRAPSPVAAAVPSASAPSASAPSASGSVAAPPSRAEGALPPRSVAAHARLAVLADEARACTRCALHVERTQAVFSRGNGSSGLCFIGEGPGADEDVQGYPFVGAAGQLLDRMIEAMGLSRDDVYVCNIVKCRPPKNRKPEPEEMAACLPYLQEQIELLEPAVIVALGATAVQGLLGTTDGITRLRGKWKLYRGRIPIMPTFHPAYLLRTPSAKREVWEDLQAVLAQMGRTAPERRR
jgi:uracil-DNA glycosylase family 4